MYLKRQEAQLLHGNRATLHAIHKCLYA